MGKLFLDIETTPSESRVGLWPAFEAHEKEAGRTFTPALYPEFCQIVSLGWAVDSEPVRAVVVDDDTTEKDILDTFWGLVRAGHVLVGFNILGFDLPVLFVRSAELGVAPTRLIDRKPWGGQVIDLYDIRKYTSGSMGLKWLADAYGFPRLDADGSMVEEMEPEQIAAYVKSDVTITRKLYNRYKGYWCP